MKKSTSSKVSRTDWKRVRAMTDKDIKLTAEHPEAKVKHIVRGIVRHNPFPSGSPSHCAWKPTCWNGSGPKGPAIRRA